mgnify:CR=1 FL=1
MITSRRVLLIAHPRIRSRWWQRYQRIYRAQQSWHGYDSTRLHRRVYRRRNRNTTQELRRKRRFHPTSRRINRINVKVKASDEETEINGRGPIIGADELEALYKQLDALTEKDTLILAGSIPSSLSSDMYELIMDRLQHKNIRIVVDATKDLLTKVLPYKPFLIKPNNHEL